MGMDFRRSVMALPRWLDPEQNNTFVDTTSKSIRSFRRHVRATGNTRLHALLDRMRSIGSRAIRDEKVAIRSSIWFRSRSRTTA